ncbi:MAG: aminotransferase class III-fold pyridoxal phosphate-dependent enzyme [Promethearchaeota archaeon]|nr:MAG: aminotransferase class III-fold pyridoxal phosphate-dependent enzyme [Candidatus Lokiarchaeota archaeon]
MSDKINLSNTFKLYEEALKLIPGAILGIRRPYNFIEGEYPIFFESAKGGKVIDVDGNEYIDMLCAYGPIIIGHREEEIDNAVIEQIRNKGFCMSLTQQVQNKLAKKLKELIPCCEKLVLMKMGTDATTAAVRVARAYTKKAKILSCGYHGWYDAFSEVHGIEAGIPKKLYEDFYEFEFNNLEEVENLFKKNKNEIAAIMVNPIHTQGGREVEMPKPGFLEGLRELATDNNTLLIYDEIRTGFRVDMGGAQKMFGVIPDLAAFGKAMGNGYPISTLVGKAEYMDVLVEKVFLSSTFFPNSLAQVASLKTIEILQREKVLEAIKEKGDKFSKQIEEYIEDSGIECKFTGSPWMPYITFDPDPNYLYRKVREEFYRQLIRRKVFLQPFHHGYIAYRHTSEDLEYAAEMIQESLKECKKIKN